MPGCKGIMLFESMMHHPTVNAIQTRPEYNRPSSGTTVNGNSSPVRNGSSLISNSFHEDEDTSRHDLPPDSDSEVDSSDSQTDHNTSPRQRSDIPAAIAHSSPRHLIPSSNSPTFQPLSSTQTTPRPSFTPFTDPSSDRDDEHKSKPTRIARRNIQATPSSASNKVGLSVRSVPNWDTKSSIVEGNGVTEQAVHTENQPIEQERERKKLERDIAVGMSNLDMFSEEIGTCIRPPRSMAC